MGLTEASLRKGSCLLPFLPNSWTESSLSLGIDKGDRPVRRVDWSHKWMMIQKLKIISPGPQIYIGLDLALRGDQDKSVDLAPKGHSLWARRQRLTSTGMLTRKGPKFSLGRPVFSHKTHPKIPKLTALPQNPTHQMIQRGVLTPWEIKGQIAIDLGLLPGGRETSSLWEAQASYWGERNSSEEAMKGWRLREDTSSQQSPYLSLTHTRACAINLVKQSPSVLK